MTLGVCVPLEGPVASHSPPTGPKPWMFENRLLHLKTVCLQTATNTSFIAYSTFKLLCVELSGHRRYPSHIYTEKIKANLLGGGNI